MVLHLFQNISSIGKFKYIAWLELELTNGMVVIFSVASVCLSAHVAMAHGPVQICSLGTALPTPDPRPCPLDMFKFVHYVVQTVGKRMVGILISWIVTFKYR